MRIEYQVMSVSSKEYQQINSNKPSLLDVTIDGTL